MGSPSRHQPLIHWKSHGPAELVETPPNAPGGVFPLSFAPQPPRELPVAMGCPTPRRLPGGCGKGMCL